MNEQIPDPASGVRYAFEPHGESLVVHAWLEPGGALAAHRHPLQEERLAVLEGTVRLQLGRSTLVIGPENGEIVVPPGVRHALSTVGGRGTRLRCVATPALRLQALLEESAAAAREGLVRHGRIPRGLRGARWLACFLERYRCETVFASPPAIVQRLLIALLARESEAAGRLSHDLPSVQDAGGSPER